MPLTDTKNMSFDIIIPTYRPDTEFAELLRSLALQVVRPNNIFVINTEKKYWNADWESEYSNLRVIHIKKSEFDHGGSRNKAAAMSTADVLVFMTQDALPYDKNTIKELVKPIEDNLAEISYCRQTPRDDADLIEQYTRNFNYPGESRIKSSADLANLGIKTFFCTNVCAAYKRDIFVSLGGFPQPVVLNEDSILAARAIEAGYRVSYAAQAMVIHSHNYSGIQQFHRNFDIGASHALYPEIFSKYPAQGEGTRLVKQTLKFVIDKKKPYLIFKTIHLSGWKFLGYSFGKHFRKLPRGVVKKWSMNSVFWDGYFAGENDKK